MKTMGNYVQYSNIYHRRKKYSHKKTFTVYVEPDTNLYHRGRCHCVTPERTYPSHILLAAKSNDPCNLCNPEMPDISWYYSLLDTHK